MKLKIKVNLPSFLIVVFSVLVLVTRMIQLPPLVANSFIVLSGLTCFFYVLINKKIGHFNGYMLIYAALATLLMLITIVYNQNASFYELLWIWTYMGVSVLLYEYVKSSRLLLVQFYCVASYFMLLALIGTESNNVLVIGSQNNISTYMLFFMMIYYLSKRRTCKQLYYAPAIFTVIISVWTSSRAGIISSVIFLFMIFLYNFLYIKKGKMKAVIKWLLLIILGLFLVGQYFDEYILELVNKIDRYGIKSVRTTIWQEYISGALSNPANFLFGLDTNDNSYRWLSYYSGNTHNAFLMLHSKFGIVGLFFVSTILVKAVKKALKNAEYIIVIVIVTFIVRSMFDWTAFPGIYDVFLWYSVLFNMDKSINKDNLPVLDSKRIDVIEQRKIK